MVQFYPPPPDISTFTPIFFDRNFLRFTPPQIDYHEAVSTIVKVPGTGTVIAYGGINVVTACHVLNEDGELMSDAWVEDAYAPRNPEAPAVPVMGIPILAEAVIEGLGDTQVRRGSIAGKMWRNWLYQNHLLRNSMTTASPSPSFAFLVLCNAVCG